MKTIKSVYIDEDVWLEAMVRARREWRMSISSLIEALLVLFLDGRLDAVLSEELGRSPRRARPAEEVLFGPEEVEE